MSPRLAARTAALCILFFGVVIARADDRRPVAVIDLTDTTAGKDLATALGAEINKSDVLKVLDDQNMPAVLMGDVTDDDASHIDDARRSKQTAESRLARFLFAEAATAAIDGWTKLGNAGPTPEAVALYADLAFVLGQAQLGARNPKEAAASFALVHRLNPSFAPDAARYLPEIVEAFDKASVELPATGKIAVTGVGRVYIDGKDVGISPVPWQDAAPGLHVVWVTGLDRDPRAKHITVVAQKKEEVVIDDAPASKSTMVRRARVALKQALDASARAVAIKQLATLLKVKDAVLLTTSNGKTIVQTWRDQAPGFSALRELKKESTPRELLTPLAPLPIPKKVKPPDPVIPKKFVVPEEPWYRNSTYQISGGVAGSVVIVVGILLIRSINRHVTLFTDTTTATGTMSR